MTIESIDKLTIMQKEVRLGDPHVNSDDRNNLSILFNLYEPLVTYGEKGEFHPCILTGNDFVSLMLLSSTFQSSQNLQTCTIYAHICGECMC